jgi:hypothetical protein
MAIVENLKRAAERLTGWSRPALCFNNSGRRRRVVGSRANVKPVTRSAET